MCFEKLLKQKLVFGLMLSLAILCGIAPQCAIAMPMDSQVSLYDGALKTAYLEKARNFFNSALVKNKLAKLGLSEKTIDGYLSGIDESGLKQLAGKIDTVESAGDTTVILILMLLLILVSVLYFNDYALKVEPRHKTKK